MPEKRGDGVIYYQGDPPPPTPKLKKISKKEAMRIASAPGTSDKWMLMQCAEPQHVAPGWYLTSDDNGRSVVLQVTHLFRLPSHAPEQPKTYDLYAKFTEGEGCPESDHLFGDIRMGWAEEEK